MSNAPKPVILKSAATNPDPIHAPQPLLIVASGYDGSQSQILKHDASGNFVWVNG